MNRWTRSAPDAGRILRGALFALAILLAASAQAQPTVEVRYAEGLLRGFLVLRAWTEPYLHMAIWRRCPATQV